MCINYISKVLIIQTDFLPSDIDFANKIFVIFNWPMINVSING